MGKVYLKTRYDSGMNMLIPHSYNIANAMYGLDGIYYAKLISARWSQLTGVKDEYRF